MTPAPPQPANRSAAHQPATPARPPAERFRLGTVAACAFGNTTGIPIVLLSVLQQSLGRAVFAELADPLLFLSLQACALHVHVYCTYPRLLLSAQCTCTCTACALRTACACTASNPLLVPSAQLLTYPLLQWTLGLALMWCNRKFGRSSSALDHYPQSPALNCDPNVSAFAEDDGGGVLPTVLRQTPSGGDDERPSCYRPPGACEEAEADPEGLLRYTGAVPLRHARRCATAASSSYIPMMSEAEDEASVQFARQFAAQTKWDSASERLHALGSLLQTFSSRDNAVRLCRRAGVLLQQLLVPPVVGVGLGALVGMLGRGLVLPPEVAPLGWLFMAVSKLGAAAVPINLILLGAALSQGPLRGELPRLNSFGVVLARLVLMPLCGLAVARFLAARINVPAEVADPFWLVCLIVTCTPTGNNIVVLCELAGDNKARLSPRTATASLCSTCPPHCIASPCSEMCAHHWGAHLL